LRKPLGSFGEGVGPVSAGVGGKDVAFEEVGVGLGESLLFLFVATGKLRDNRFGLRGVYDKALACFAAGWGGGAMAKYALLGEVPT
jgi:hypothetical protein